MCGNARAGAATRATGTLSRHESSVPQLMQADGGETTERLSGTRAATTFRNDPMASAGKKASPAAAKLMTSLSAAGGRGLMWNWVPVGMAQTKQVVRVGRRAFGV